MKIDTLIQGDSVAVMAEWPDDSIDLTVTSPPYDDMRRYHGYVFDSITMLQSLFRVTKPGGIVVWVVNDKIKNGNRSLTSFRHAFEARDVGFKIHDAMVYVKTGVPCHRANACRPQHELMLVLAKGSVSTFNPPMQDNVTAGRVVQCQTRNKADESQFDVVRYCRPSLGIRGNVWTYSPGRRQESGSNLHPGVMPDALAGDHIQTWSNAGDLVLDPMCGSGTTCRMAKRLGRRFIGVDISSEYLAIARRRVDSVPESLGLTQS